MKRFYKPTDLDMIMPIIDNKYQMVDEISRAIVSGCVDDTLIQFQADIHNHEGVGEWRAVQTYYNNTRNNKTNKQKWISREAKKQWISNLRQAPAMYPVMTETLQACPCVYWGGISKSGSNSHILPHKHTYKTPTLLLQICITPGVSDSDNCYLVVGGEKMFWRSKYQVNIFDGRYEHELVNKSSSSRYILHVEFNPT